MDSKVLRGMNFWKLMMLDSIDLSSLSLKKYSCLLSWFGTVVKGCETSLERH